MQALARLAIFGILLAVNASKSTFGAEKRGWHADFPAALEAAKSKQTLVLVDFSAPWCYSCYYMALHVLSQPEFAQLREDFEPVLIDVDSPEGLRLKTQWGVAFLPSYVVIDATQREIGRIVGEQTRDAFYSRLRQIIQQRSAISGLESRLLKAPAADRLSLAIKILETYNSRNDSSAGLRFLQNLPLSLKTGLYRDVAAQKEILRLQLNKARASQDASTCLKVARSLFKHDLDCALPYDAQRANECTESLPLQERLPVYRQQAASLQPLLEKRVFVPARDRCADLRSPVVFGADLYEKLNRKDDADKILDRAIRLLRGEIQSDWARDRSSADNLRAFLDRAGRGKELEELFPKLISAYPNDYVYSYRFGKYLLEAGRAAAAIKHLEAAYSKSYGLNKLKVVELRAKALAQAGRKEEAAKTLDRSLKDAPAVFSEQIDALRRLKEEIQK